MAEDEVLDLSPASKLLKECWLSGRLLTELPPQYRPTPLNQGYDFQDHFIEQVQGTRSGWKLGVGSPAQRRLGNLSRPLIGQVLESRCFESGSHLSLPSDDPITVECEVAFVLDRDIEPGQSTNLVEDDIRCIYITFEIVRSRFADRRAVGWPSFVADNVGFEAFEFSVRPTRLVFRYNRRRVSTETLMKTEPPFLIYNLR